MATKMIIATSLVHAKQIAKKENKKTSARQTKTAKAGITPIKTDYYLISTGKYAKTVKGKGPGTGRFYKFETVRRFY